MANDADKTAPAAGWRTWVWNPPPPGLLVILGREPDRIIRHEPIPMPVARKARSLPPWVNINGLLWRPA
jgi:hypothetical protein